jgi:peptidoglycan/LPS O-acetylase OafA/YrhL
VTVLRIVQHASFSIVTWQRIDEILAGASLALFHARSPAWARALPPMLPLLLFPLLLATAHEAGGALAYLRPYVAAAMVGSSIYAAPGFLRRWSGSRTARYIADVSFALYVFHGMLVATWLGTGDTLVRYAKRPLLFAATFALAHLSTYRFEHPMIGWGKRIEKRRAALA